MVLSHLECLLLKYNQLAIILPYLPLCLHFLDLYVHFLLQVHPLLNLQDFLIETAIELGDVRLGTVNVLLIERLELQYLFLELDVQLVHMVQLLVLLVEPLPVLIYEL